MTTHIHTAIILGGGPAGCQCALWLKNLGFDPVIIEPSDHLGGLQAESPYQNHWIVGLIDTTGRELALNIQKHIEMSAIPVYFHAKINAIHSHDHGYQVELRDGTLQARYLVIATGSIQRKDKGPLINYSSQADHDAAYAKLNMSSQSGWQANLPSALKNMEGQLLNKDGFIITNQVCETPVQGIFAIGEAANRMHPCVATSMADGVVAAKAIQTILG